MHKIRLMTAAFMAWAMLIAAPVSAQFTTLQDQSGLTESAGAAGLRASEVNPSVIIGRIIGALISLLGIIFVVLLVYGGFTWMTAQGAEDKIKKAKGIISSAIIGLVVVFASYAISQAVISALVVATNGGGAAAPTP